MAKRSGIQIPVEHAKRYAAQVENTALGREFNHLHYMATSGFDLLLNSVNASTCIVDFIIDKDGDAVKNGRIRHRLGGHHSSPFRKDTTKLAPGSICCRFV